MPFDVTDPFPLLGDQFYKCLCQYHCILIPLLQRRSVDMSASPKTDLVALRKELLNPVLSDSHYIARPDYLNTTTWIQIPVFDQEKEETVHVSLLFGSEVVRLYTTSIIGRVNADDLRVSPQGDCSQAQPNHITGACLRLSLSSPQIKDYLILDRDFGVALNNLQHLADSLSMQDVNQPHMIDVVKITNRINFYYPLMFERHSVRLILSSFDLLKIR